VLNPAFPNPALALAAAVAVPGSLPVVAAGVNAAGKNFLLPGLNTGAVEVLENENPVIGVEGADSLLFLQKWINVVALQIAVPHLLLTLLLHQLPERYLRPRPRLKYGHTHIPYPGTDNSHKSTRFYTAAASYHPMPRDSSAVAERTSRGY
jgi:hypothetical protein